MFHQLIHSSTHPKPIHPSVRLSNPPAVGKFIHLFTPIAHPPIHPSIHPNTHPFIY